MPDTLQRAKQWGPGRAPSTAETLHPDALIDAALQTLNSTAIVARLRAPCTPADFFSGPFLGGAPR